MVFTKWIEFVLYVPAISVNTNNITVDKQNHNPIAVLQQERKEMYTVSEDNRASQIYVEETLISQMEHVQQWCHLLSC